MDQICDKNGRRFLSTSAYFCHHCDPSPFIINISDQEVKFNHTKHDNFYFEIKLTFAVPGTQSNRTEELMESIKSILSDLSQKIMRDVWESFLYPEYADLLFPILIDQEYNPVFFTLPMVRDNIFNIEYTFNH